MQLVVLANPESLDIKKNMSTLSETLDHFVMNDAETNNQADEAINKPSPNNDVSITNNTKQREPNKQKDVKIIEYNGISKTNGYLQIDNSQKEHVELVIESSQSNNENIDLVKGETDGLLNVDKYENNENKSSVDDTTNCSSDLDKPVVAPIIAEENISTEKEYTKLDDRTVANTCEYSIVKENKEITNDLKSPNKSEHSKSDTVDICLENTSDTTLLINEKVRESEELKDLNVSVTNVDVSYKESTFSPYFDEKDFDISEQLQLLNKDKSIEEDVTPSTDAKFIADRVTKTKNEDIKVNQTETVDEILTEIIRTEKNDVDSTNKQELAISKNQSLDMEVNQNADDSSIELVKNYNSKDIYEISNTFAKNVTVEQSVETKTNNEAELNLAIDSITDNITADEKKTKFTIVEQPAGMEKYFNIDVNMEIGANNDTVKVQEVNKIHDTDKVSVEHKYITVKKLTDLTDSVSSTNETAENNEAIRQTETLQNEVMDVDEKLTDLTDSVSSTNETAENNDAIRQIETLRNEVMDVDEIDKLSVAASENIIHLGNGSDNMQKLHTNSNIETAEDKTANGHTETFRNEVVDIDEIDKVSSTASKNISNIETTKNNEAIRQTETLRNKVINEVKDVDEVDKVSSAVSENNINLGNSSDNMEKLETIIKTAENVHTETLRNKVMGVNIIDKQSLVIPENNINPVKQTNDDIKHTDNKTDGITEDSNKLDDNSMKVDDIEELSVPERSNHWEHAVGKSNIKDEDFEKVTQKQDSISVSEKDNVSRNVSVSDNASDVISIDDTIKDTVAVETEKSTDVEIVGDDDIKVIVEKEKQHKMVQKKPLPVVCKLSNTMDILSDDEDEPSSSKPEEHLLNDKSKKDEDESKCINLDDDDDIMFIEDNSQEANQEQKPEKSDKVESQITKNNESKTDDTDEKESSVENKVLPKISEKDDPSNESSSQPTEETKPVTLSEEKAAKPLVTKTFLKTVTKSLADMTRNELEDFCILKLVESIAERSNLNEIKNKMKVMAQTIEDLKKKSQSVTKQNRDLHLVVKTVQGDQKNRCLNPMMPMKITRSVGMQVALAGQTQIQIKKKIPLPPTTPAPARSVRNAPSPKTPKPVANNIPVPRLIPAVSPTTAKPPAAQNSTKPPTITRNPPQQRPEKRPHNKLSPGSSVTVDLTDDEPPTKINAKTPTPPVRLVPSQNLMPKTRPQFPPSSNSPRKVYIPISANAPNVRPAPAAGVIKNFITPPRPRQPVVRMPNRSITTLKHPAPLPDAMKQYQPPTWKALPPPPDLKLSKVDNGIVISWKFEGYQPDSYEEVASFQLYAYQETPVPPSTTLWKKIGDIKALPLPMACTLTQFMSGFKYYFAVRAIDVRSRIGPFSMPGSIMLISKS